MISTSTVSAYDNVESKMLAKKQFNTLMYSVPCIDSMEVAKFREKFGLPSFPIEVPCQPIAEAQERRCYSNVSNHITKNGGEGVVGWVIWNNLDLFIEGELHAIWKNDQGAFLDITPSDCLFSKHLFIPDPSMTFSGMCIDNLRMPLEDDHRIIEYIQVKHEIFLRTLAGVKYGEQRRVPLTPELEKLEYRRFLIAKEVMVPRAQERMKRARLQRL